MARNIVYIQANDKIADSFKRTFAEREIELIIAHSAMEAIDYMKENVVDVLLVDINIPDMRLSKLVEICSRDFPGVVLNVCVDVMNSLLVTKLVNRHAIRKIFVAPWDVKEMVEEIEESLDAAQIAREQKIYENRIIKENEHFEETLSSLTESLKKQQYSYNKFKSLTDLILDSLSLINEDINFNQYDKVKKIFDMYLRMQTTDAIDIDKFEEILREDMNRISAACPGFKCTDISSCLIGDVPKSRAANIRFLVWLIATYAAHTRSNCEYIIDSQFKNVTEVTFVLTVNGQVTEPDELMNKYVTILADSLCDSVNITTETKSATTEESVKYNFDFLVVADSE